MKKIVILVLALTLALILLTSCGKKGGAVTGEGLLAYLPQSSNGVVVLDMNRIMNTDAATKAIKEDKAFQKYQEFVQKTGIDPQKDLHFIAVGLAGDMTSKSVEPAVIVSMNYKKDDLLAKIKAEAKVEIQETTYNSVTLYTVPEEQGKKQAYVAFLDASLIAGGSETSLKSVIDVYQKKSESALKNEALSGILKGVRKDAMAWCAFSVPGDVMEKAASENPMMANLKGLYGLTMLFDYKNKTLVAEIKGLNKDEAKNKEIATMLDGLKAMGAMASTKEPGLGELLDKILISSGPNDVTISADIPEDLLNKLKAKAEEKVQGMIPKKPAGEEEAPKEEIKD